MNKIKSLFFLLFCFTSFACIAVPPVSAQDYKLGIGKAWIRYDADSNMLKFGAPIQPPKIAREFNSPLFNFNSTEFFWSNITGLNLLPDYRRDTTIAHHLIIQKDTGDGEFIPYNKRTYTIYKPYYHNQLDIFDLKVKYESTANPSATTEFNLFNNAYILFDNQSLEDDIVQSVKQYYFSFPRAGSYYINASFEYAILESQFHQGENSFSVNALLLKSPHLELEGGYYNHYVTPDVPMAFRNHSNLNVIVNVTADELDSYLFEIGGITMNNYPIYIYKLRITAILIN